jgi:hypothetical protein
MAGVRISVGRFGAVGRIGPRRSLWVWITGPIQSALAVAIVLVSGLAATLPRGWMTPTWTVGVAAAWLAVAAWVNPDLAASMSRPWASAALAWAVAFVIAEHLSNARQSRRRNRPSNLSRSP